MKTKTMILTFAWILTISMHTAASDDYFETHAGIAYEHMTVDADLYFPIGSKYIERTNLEADLRLLEVGIHSTHGRLTVGVNLSNNIGDGVNTEANTPANYNKPVNTKVNRQMIDIDFTYVLTPHFDIIGGLMTKETVFKDSHPEQRNFQHEISSYGFHVGAQRIATYDRWGTLSASVSAYALNGRFADTWADGKDLNREWQFEGLEKGVALSVGLHKKVTDRLSYYATLKKSRFIMEGDDDSGNFTNIGSSISLEENALSYSMGLCFTL